MKNKIALNPHAELPLKEDSANLFLEIMTAVSVFLFTLALTGYLLLNSAATGWSRGITDSLTVQILPESKQLSAEEENLRINKVITFFENQAFVERVMLLSDKQIKGLLKPWLGENVDPDSLPLPKLLDIRLKPGENPDYTQVAGELVQTAPYASIDNHRVWLNRLLDFARSLKLLSLSILLMVLLASAFSIFYATRTSLGIHSRIIEILHIMGAADDYIARQYARRSFWIGLFAGAGGLAAAVAAIMLIKRFAAGLDSGLIGAASLSSNDWLYIAALPLWTALLSMLTAYWTVKQTLRKMM